MDEIAATAARVVWPVPSPSPTIPALSARAQSLHAKLLQFMQDRCVCACRADERFLSDGWSNVWVPAC